MESIKSDIWVHAIIDVRQTDQYIYIYIILQTTVYNSKYLMSKMATSGILIITYFWVLCLTRKKAIKNNETPMIGIFYVHDL